MTTEEKKQPFSGSALSSHQALAFKRKIKFLLAMPLLVLPFLTTGFWALDGGKGKEEEVANAKEGLNLELPSAELKPDEGADKLSFYEKARQEEEKNREAMRNDPYLRRALTDSNELDDIVANNTPVHSGSYKDPNEEKIMRRIQQLQQEINQPASDPSYRDDVPEPERRDLDISNDVDRLEEMMKLMQGKKETDPEMQNLEGMLDKILDIQHPQRVSERIKEKSVQQKRSVFPVLRTATIHSASFLKADTRDRASKSNNAFYGTSENRSHEEEANAVEAVVHQTQTVINGSKIKLRLVNDIYINGALIPAGNFLFAEVAINDQRMQMEIHSIVYNHSIFPVQLIVYDMDGLSGINIPDVISRNVLKQGGDNALQSMELNTLNPSLAAQATTAGINTAKSLLSRKVNQVKVSVKSGYRVLLVNADNGQ